jgi:hypothetical protein
MEAICSYETSVDFQRSTRRFIPEESTFNSDILPHDLRLRGMTCFVSQSKKMKGKAIHVTGRGGP